MPSNDLLKQHPWPEALPAFLARALDFAGIPHLIWGDIVLSTHGVPVCPAICAFVVAREHVQRAQTVINDAGMQSYYCTCKDFLHCANPENNSAMGIHWFIKSQMSFVTVCTNEDTFHDLLPVTATHPNPLNLEVLSKVYAVGTAGVVEMAERDQHGGHATGSTHTLRYLSRISLFKLLLILFLTELPPRGVALPWGISIGYLASYSGIEGRRSLYDNLDEGLQLVYDYLLGDCSIGNKSEMCRIARKSSPSYQVCVPLLERQFPSHSRLAVIYRYILSYWPFSRLVEWGLISFTFQ